MTTYVIHSADHDGRLAACFAHMYFSEKLPQESVVFREAQYGKPFPLTPDELGEKDEVFVFGFLTERETLDAIYEKSIQLFRFFSHMESAEKRFGDAPYASISLDMTSAVRAFHYFFPDKRLPKLAQLVSDRKLWKKKYPETPQMNAWLNYAQLGNNWDKWQELMDDQESYEIALKYGRLLLRHQDRMIEEFIKAPGAVLVQHGHLVKDHSDKNTKYAIYNNRTPYPSDTAQAVFKEYDVDYTIDWRVDMGRDVVVFDIRSRDVEKFSALEYAEKHSGGGQADAAGFTMHIVDGLQLVKNLGL
jgi:hypothetical protein